MADPILDQDSAEEGETVAIELRELLEEVQAREKVFEQGWWKEADSAEKLFNAEEEATDTLYSSKAPYNILYSNTEVLLPSVYSATPKPDVRPRFKGEKVQPIAQLVERFLIVIADPAAPGEECVDEAMKDGVLSALVPGAGLVRLRYFQNRAIPLSFESVHHRSVIWSKGKRWSKIRWLAFKHELDKDAVKEKFSLDEEEMDNFSPEEKGDRSEQDEKLTIYEVWDKESKTIRWISPDWKAVEILAEPDTMQLKGFFPTPGLIQFTSKPGKIQPTPLFTYYKNQAEELNRVTVRLNRVLSAIRVRGAYNTLLGTDLEKILNDEDSENKLHPAQEGAMLAQQGGFDKQIWLLPIEKLIQVAQQLYMARQQIKTVIYELTGISDIIRGSSVASETATAQDLKNKWGTIRLRKMQAHVANYVRDLFRLAVDCGSTLIPPAQWAEITQVQLPTKEQKIQVQTQASMMQMQGMEIPPEMQTMLTTPSIDEVVAKIREDSGRTFTVNIQTSSTIDIDTAADKQEVNEFMGAMGQLVTGLQPLAQLGPTGLNAAKAVLIAVSQRFKFGSELGDAFSQLQAPPPAEEKPDPKAQIELQVAQEEAKAKIAQIQLDTQLAQAKAQLEREKLALEQQKIEAEKVKLGLDLQRAQLQLARDKAKMAATPPQGGKSASVPV